MIRFYVIIGGDILVWLLICFDYFELGLAIFLSLMTFDLWCGFSCPFFYSPSYSNFNYEIFLRAFLLEQPNFDQAFQTDSNYQRKTHRFNLNQLLSYLTWAKPFAYIEFFFFLKPINKTARLKIDWKTQIKFDIFLRCLFSKYNIYRFL